jgi:senataxin
MKESKKEYSYSEANDGSEEGEVEKVEIAKVPSQFRSYDHYFSVWKPLALEEVQAQTLNNVSTDTPGPISITATGFGTTFLSKTCKIRVEVKKQAGPRMHHNAMRDQLDSVFVNDLVLITPSRRYFQNFLATSKGSGRSAASSDTGAEDAKLPPQGMLGIVTTQKASREGLTMIVLGSQWRSMDQAEELFLYKLNNLVTSVREFRALCDCREYELMPLLLSGQHQKGSMRLDSLGIEYVRWLNNAFNDSQLEAITAAATSEGFTLIKGPPGTGKTTTLKGLLNSLHLREYSRYYNAVLDVARRPDHETSKAWAAIGNEKPHILVRSACR